MAKKINKLENESPEVKSAPAKKVVKPKTKPVEKEKSAVRPKAVTPKKTETKTATINIKAVEPYSRFTDFDVALFKSGKHYKLYEKFGSHVIEFNGVIGTYFAVWA